MSYRLLFFVSNKLFNLFMKKSPPLQDKIRYVDTENTAIVIKVSGLWKESHKHKVLFSIQKKRERHKLTILKRIATAK